MFSKITAFASNVRTHIVHVVVASIIATTLFAPLQPTKASPMIPVSAPHATMMTAFAPTIASVEIAIDTDPLFNSMNDFLPTAMQIIGIPAGIGLAFLIVTFIVSAFFRYIRGTV